MFTPVHWPARDHLTRQAEATPMRTALVDADAEQSWTYGALADGPVAELASALRRAGVEPGDHLGVLVPPGVEVAKLHHAAARAGAVFVPLSPDAPEAVLEDRCRTADVDALVTADATGGRSCWFDGPVIDPDERAGSAASSRAHRWARDDVQWLVFTSGTTGEPKAVQLTAGNLVASATASALRLGVEPEDRWLACLPTHHVGGLAPFVRSALYGTATVVQSGFDADRTAAAITNQGITGVSLVPTMLDRLLDAGWAPPDALRFVLLGGAPADRELIDRCEAAGVPVHPTYGATETASQIATARPAEAFDRPGTVGRPLEGIGVAVRDDSGDPVPPGTVGELVVSGPVVSPGYYADAEATAARFEHGAFHTGDRGYRDDAGRLWVVGRVDDAIQTGGVTVQPETVAAALRSHPAVAEAAVVGLEDDEWGEVVAALVATRSERSVDVAALRGHCRDRLEAPAVPKHLEVGEELPRTASGTVDRAAVRDRLRASRRGGL